MFKLTKLAVVTAALVSTSAFAGINDNDFYIGVGVGQSNMKPDYENGSKGPTDRDMALQVYAGYDIGENFGVEANYADLGELDLGSSGTTSIGYGVSSLQGLIYLPSSSDQLSLYAKLGVSYLHINNPHNIAIDVEHKWSASGAVGARWNMSENWFARAEYNVYNSDIHAAFLQLGFAFGGSEPVAAAPVPAPAPEPAPYQAPEPTYVSVDESTNVGGIFDFDSASINNSARLDQIAAMLENSTGPIIVRAHTDSVGAEAYNQKLSEQRAQSAVDYLASKGVDSSRLVAQGMGESHPVASNQTKEGRAQNRRLDVEYTVNKQQ